VTTGSSTGFAWAPGPDWFETPAGFPNITAGLLDAGFGRDEVAAIMGGNWLRLFSDAFKPAA
jgi:microsomal dipeptidase-like Zn-dependent dipeptidase